MVSPVTVGVAVVGAGPGGLAVAGALKETGIEAVVLEESGAVGASWRHHYDRLHLHTVRWLSGLPGFAIPRHYGRWVSRADLVTYLEEYTRRLGLEVRTGTRVERIESDPSGWLLRTATGAVLARQVVVATGYNREPLLPDWPGREAFAGRLLHSAEYRNGKPFAARDVLVVGSGNSGAEIAVDLVESGARQVFISVRTPPNIQRRAVLGLPTQVIGVLASRLPGPLIDRISLAMQKSAIGSLEEFGLSAPLRGVHARVLDDEQIPLIDVGFIAALRNRQVSVVPGVVGFDAAGVVLEGGRRLRVDDVVAATGYRRALESLVGHLDVLGPSGRPRANGAAQIPDRPGLFFIGYTNPLGGNLREMAIDARRIASAIRVLRSSRVAKTSGGGGGS